MDRPREDRPATAGYEARRQPAGTAPTPSTDVAGRSRRGGSGQAAAPANPSHATPDHLRDPRYVQEARDAMAEAARNIARHAPDDDYEFESAVALAREAYEDEIEQEAEREAPREG